MPNYGFKCNKCNITFDQILPLSQCDVIIDCPKCKSKKHVCKTYNHPLPIKFNCHGFSTTYRG